MTVISAVDGAAFAGGLLRRVPSHVPVHQRMVKIVRKKNGPRVGDQVGVSEPFRLGKMNVIFLHLRSAQKGGAFDPREPFRQNLARGLGKKPKPRIADLDIEQVVIAGHSRVPQDSTEIQGMADTLLTVIHYEQCFETEALCLGAKPFDDRVQKMQLNLHRACPIQVPVTKKVEGVELQKIQARLSGNELAGIGRNIGKRKDCSVETLALQQREERLDSVLMKRTRVAAAKAPLDFDAVQFESPPPTRFYCGEVVLPAEAMANALPCRCRAIRQKVDQCAG